MRILKTPAVAIDNKRTNREKNINNLRKGNNNQQNNSKQVSFGIKFKNIVPFVVPMTVGVIILVASIFYDNAKTKFNNHHQKEINAGKQAGKNLFNGTYVDEKTLADKKKAFIQGFEAFTDSVENVIELGQEQLKKNAKKGAKVKL